jgi:ATP-binding cassette subfamily C protein CydD
MTPQQWLARQRLEVAGRLRAAALFGVIEGVLIIAQAGLIAWIVQQTIMAERLLATLTLPIAALMGVVLLRPVLQRLRAGAGIRASAHVRASVHARLLAHAEALGPGGAQGISHGEISSQLTDQVSALDGYFSRYLPQMQIAIIVPLAIAAAAFTQDWIAASFLLLAAPLIPLFMALVGMGAERLNRDQFIALGRLSGQFLDRVQGLTTLRLFGRSRDATNGIIGASDAYRIRSMRVLRVAFLSSAVLEFFASIAIAVVAIYVGFGLLGYIEYGPAPALTLFSGLFVLLLAPEFFQPLRTLAQHYHDRATALGAAELLVNFQALEPSDFTVASAQSNTQALTRLAVRDLELSRPGRGVVLQVAQLHADPGEIILIEGPSGSGKTTLLMALGGLLAPTSGEISRAFANRHIAWLGAPAFLASASLRENIILGNPKATPEAIDQAAQQAGVMEFAGRLSHGLDTAVGERGIGLSGGQAQRVALARAFVSRAPLILLDEPTAALDADTEQIILNSLSDLAQAGRVIVIASHDKVLRSKAHRRYCIKDHHLIACTPEPSHA